MNEYEFVLIDSKVKHEHSTSGYNTRPKERKKALKILNHNYKELSSISDLKLDELSVVKSLLTPLLFKRVSFIVEENHRVAITKTAIESNNMNLLGEVLYQSHDGLKNKYQVSCNELDFLVEQTKDASEILGSRMMGGGFGGCSINLIKKRSGNILEQIINNYQIRFNIKPSIYFVNISDGVKVI